MIYAFDDMNLGWHRHDGNDQPPKQRDDDQSQFLQSSDDRLALTQQRDSLWSLEPSYPITDLDSISLPEISPVGSESFSLLPLPHLSLHTMDLSSLHAAAGDPQVDSALEEYTQLWRQLVEDSSLFGFDSLSSNDHQLQGLGFEAEPTPPLDVETSPLVHFAPDVHVNNVQESATSAVELVAPKPRRLVNPAIHLAALVEEDDNSVTATGLAVEGVQDVVLPVQEEVQGMLQEDVPPSVYGHSMEQLREYMSESDGEMEDCTTAFNVFPSSEPSSDMISFDNWSFPQADLAPVPVHPVPFTEASSSSMFPHVNQQWNTRTSQLRETMRERRVARQVMQTHSRHASLPDVHYRPINWNCPIHGVPQRTVVPVQRRERDASRSVDWSAFAFQNNTLVPLPNDLLYLPTAQYPPGPLYGIPPTYFPFGAL